MQFRQLASLVAVATLGLLFTGCASIVSGTRQDVRVNSTPQAADVKIERLSLNTNMTAFEGKTPATASLERKGTYLVTISLNGYEKAEVPIDGGGMNGWVWGNILIGGMIGIFIDISTGSAVNLRPDDINVTLTAQKSSRAGGAPEIAAVIERRVAAGRIVRVTQPLKPVSP